MVATTVRRRLARANPCSPLDEPAHRSICAWVRSATDRDGPRVTAGMATRRAWRSAVDDRNAPDRPRSLGRHGVRGAGGVLGRAGPTPLGPWLRVLRRAGDQRPDAQPYHQHGHRRREVRPPGRRVCPPDGAGRSGAEGAVVRVEPAGASRWSSAIDGRAHRHHVVPSTCTLAMRAVPSGPVWVIQMSTASPWRPARSKTVPPPRRFWRRATGSPHLASVLGGRPLAT